jgi:hypothetical protein
MPTYITGGDGNSYCTIDGDGNFSVEEANWDATCGMDEVSNIQTGGFYASVKTLKKGTGSMKIVYDGDLPPSFEEGDTIAVTMGVTGGPGFTGNVNITKMAWPTFTPKSAIRFNLDWESNGPYTKTGMGG